MDLDAPTVERGAVPSCHGRGQPFCRLVDPRPPAQLHSRADVASHRDPTVPVVRATPDLSSPPNGIGCFEKAASRRIASGTLAFHTEEPTSFRGRRRLQPQGDSDAMLVVTGPGPPNGASMGARGTGSGGRRSAGRATGTSR